MRISLIISFIIFFFHFGVSQERYDLSECLNYTLINSPKLKAEKLAQEKETLSTFEGKSAYLPHIDGFLNYHNYFNDLPTYIFPQAEGSVLAGEPIQGTYPVPLGLPHNLNTGFEISQTIFDMNFFGSNAFLSHYQSYKEIRLSIAEEEILYQVATLFYQVAINEEKLRFLDLNLERLGKLQSIIQLQVDQGFAKMTDYEKLLVKTSNLKSKKNKLQAGMLQQRRYLQMMMGMPQEEEIQLLFGELESTLMGDTEVVRGELLEERMLNEQRELNRLNNRRINAEYYPRLQAYAAFLFQAQRDRLNFLASGQDWYNVHQWGIRLSVPILRGFEKKTKKELSQIVDSELALGLEQKQELIEVELQNAISSLEIARAEQQMQQENVKLAEKIYRQSQLSYEQGTMLLMDFLDSEATLRESKMMYATAVLDTRMAELKILKASGNLKELVNP